MIQYGSRPAADVVEVTLFGPGYGEAWLSISGKMLGC